MPKLLTVLVLSLVFAQLSLAHEPQLQRVKMTTVSTGSIKAFERRYRKWLGYEVAERGKVSRSLAMSWGAPKTEGRSYILMNAPGSPEVFIRGVDAPPVRGYAPMTTWGWNAIEIIVDDPVGLRETFPGSPFTVIGEPKGLNSYPSIVAFQVDGPDREVLYLTAETGDRQKSTLPLPNGPVGRVFIMVLAGPDVQALLDWYADAFNMTAGPARTTPIGVVQRAQGLSAGDEVGIGLIRLTEHGNLIEFDGYSAAHSGPRPFRPGELVPGIAITSFNVPDLDALELAYISPPTKRSGRAYDGARSATVRGPVGELIELIER